MITAKELRIGNKVMYGDNIRTITMVMDSGKSIKIGVDLLITTIDYIAPVPLTPEILEKAGFKYDAIRYNDFQINGSWDRGGFTLNVYSNGSMCFEWGTNGDAQELEHVHQLQNLYFALTNTELNINL